MGVVLVLLFGFLRKYIFESLVDRDAAAVDVVAGVVTTTAANVVNGAMVVPDFVVLLHVGE